VSASPLGKDLAAQSGVELDRAGRVKVLPDLTIPGNPHVWVVGDMMAVDGARSGGGHPGRVRGQPDQGRAGRGGTGTRAPFKYFDKGRWRRCPVLGGGQGGPLEFGGYLAWLAWLFLHLIYLVGFRTKIATLLSWANTFLSRGRGQLTITEQQAYARTRIEQLEEIAATVEDGGR
jgi:NADH dehydrogenase